MAEKVTGVNVEGRNYEFLAGQAVRGACTALAADWVKPVTLPEGTQLVDGLIVAVMFVNETSVGWSGTKTVYSSDGLHFFYDQELTDPVELPPAGCYDAVNVQGQEYTLACFPVITFGSLSLPVCDSRGHYAGGALWAAGDTVAALYLNEKFMLLYSVVDEVKLGVSSPVSSNAVAVAFNGFEVEEYGKIGTNGYYVKYANGLMEQYEEKTFPNITLSQLNYNWRANISVALAKPYKTGSLPIAVDIHINAVYSRSNRVWLCSSNDSTSTNSTVAFDIVSDYPYNTSGQKYMLHTKGWWK